MDLKNACYNSQLETLKGGLLYKNVYSFFKNDFSQRQATSKSLLHKSADEAIFFSADSTKCILLVLERSDQDIKGQGSFFGSARAYEGSLVGPEWKFKESTWFTFDGGYFKKYSENSFENIAKVARYTVLSSGDASFGGCEIDEAYWFEND
jgi:hypothetical protein